MTGEIPKLKDKEIKKTLYWIVGLATFGTVLKETITDGNIIIGIIVFLSVMGSFELAFILLKRFKLYKD